MRGEPATAKQVGLWETKTSRREPTVRRRRCRDESATAKQKVGLWETKKSRGEPAVRRRRCVRIFNSKGVFLSDNPFEYSVPLLFDITSLVGLLGQRYHGLGGEHAGHLLDDAWACDSRGEASGANVDGEAGAVVHGLVLALVLGACWLLNELE
ncbi:hypothetical protein Cni_G18878 [Canna indica]|uniref:Uncharacterized protein n=1 Tax=Canna indica TaxID=4628 RepID=A0AAQ3QGG2_9LILI|nr:hypothetical protein Cni_G18878 [Canna indica]